MLHSSLESSTCRKIMKNRRQASLSSKLHLSATRVPRSHGCGLLIFTGVRGFDMPLAKIVASRLSNNVTSMELPSSYSTSGKTCVPVEWRISLKPSMYHWLIGLVGLLEDWVCNSLSKRPWDGILLRNKM